MNREQVPPVSKHLRCPRCGSRNIAPAEREFKTDYPFWIVLVVALALLCTAVAVFLLLQLHPVILILVVIAIVSALLDTKSRRKKKAEKREFICLDCEKRFRLSVSIKNNDHP
jgi:hypothetical protein